ncbi:hypothetical protein HU200_010306 [Digitaria exilis]|uniref:DUF4220 domain-containing protein n=1 Tax=Digitaria exilis TaxID=1010633 RepID=A0A835FHJ6_9POAL|nr:hypothetical protein HU200_010306 [Digitaria exilis]
MARWRQNNLLKAAILLFIPGVLKCLEKPLALKNASINSLVSSSKPAQRTANRQGEISLLDQYVREAKDIVLSSIQHESQDTQQEEEAGTAYCDPYDLFVDLASPYPKRLSILKSFCAFKKGEAYKSLQVGLSNAFGLLYTKQNTFGLEKSDPNRDVDVLSILGSLVVRYCCLFMSFASIGLFHHSHREGYNGRDVKVTYILLCCTAALEVHSISFRPRLDRGWPGMVPQYSLVGFFVRNKKHAKKMSIVSFFGCKQYLDQHWCIKSCSSSQRITVLVLRYLKAGWRDYVQDAASYWMFNDHRGQWTLERNKCNYLAWSLNCPFDESVLLWHVATDLCFYSGKFAGHRCDFSVQCRQMSNYMMYLLFVNPEMLLPGSRRNLFTTAYGELKGILEDKKPAATMEDSAGTRQGNKPPVEEGFLHDAWSLAQGLLDLGNEKKMWEVIEGVWVEMLCFSAGRCRGYLHAKSLGTGGELLTYIWLPLSHMGMETLAERLQRTELPSSGGNTRAAAGEGIV